MRERWRTDASEHVGIAAPAIATAEDWEDRRGNDWKAEGLPRTSVKTIERTAVVRFEDAEIVFEESAIRSIGDQLRRLIKDEGHTRLLVNFGGVRYLSSDVLAILAGLQLKLDPARGRIQLCELDPLLRDMLRITHLDRVFDLYADEAEALGLLVRR
jgi:anti-sigma B factor antagonist